MTTPIPADDKLPQDLVQELQRAAAAMGISVAAYVRLLHEQRRGTLDAKAADAAAYVMKSLGPSMRKLAQ